MEVEAPNTEQAGLVRPTGLREKPGVLPRRSSHMFSSIQGVQMMMLAFASHKQFVRLITQTDLNRCRQGAPLLPPD